MKLITSNKLNKFWKSGVLPIKNALTGKQDKSKVLNTKEAIMANTSSEYAAGALVVKELNNNLGGNNLIYNESEDAYYIQHGADSALKKLGSGGNFTISAIVTFGACYVNGGAMGTAESCKITIKYNNGNISVTGAPSGTLSAITAGSNLKLSGFKINSITWE